MLIIWIIAPPPNQCNASQGKQVTVSDRPRSCRIATENTRIRLLCRPLYVNHPSLVHCCACNQQLGTARTMSSSSRSSNAGICSQLNLLLMHDA